jgi:hypothetical protein
MASAAALRDIAGGQRRAARVVDRRSQGFAMDSGQFARLAQVIAGSTRRRMLGFGSAGALGVLGARLGAAGAEGRKGKKKRKKKKKASPLHLAFRCPGPPTFVGFCASGCRVAQVFRTTRGGRLSRIQIHINKEADSTGDYVVYLMRVDNTDTPLHQPLDILAATSIPDSDVPAGESLLTANFAGPRLEAQTDYAAAVGRVGEQIDVGTVSGTTCGGQIFSAHGLEAFDSGSSDLVVSVFVA